MRRHRPPHPKEGKTGDHQYPRGNPPPPQKTAITSPKARERAVNRRSEPEHAEVPPMKERPAVGGRKPDPYPRKIEEDREVFQLPESRGNWRPTEGPRTPELDRGTTSGRATNDQIERQETPHCDRRPASWSRKRRGGADARHSRRSSTQVVESPSKAAVHSLTLALDAEATAANLGYDRSN